MGGQKFIGGDRNGPVPLITICYNCICIHNYSLALCSIIVACIYKNDNYVQSLWFWYQNYCQSFSNHQSKYLSYGISGAKLSQATLAGYPRHQVKMMGHKVLIFSKLIIRILLAHCKIECKRSHIGIPVY